MLYITVCLKYVLLFFFTVLILYVSRFRTCCYEMLTVLCFVLIATTATGSSEWEMNSAPRFINDNIHNERDVQVPKNVPRPPSIYFEPPYEIYYKAGETFELPCEANGEPKPTYDWNRNEIVFNPSGNDDRIVQLPDAGTLVINMPEDKDEGIFQCFAINDFGKSASKKVNLRQAKLASFAFVKPTYHKPYLGRPYTLPCVPPESVPPASVFWITKTAQGGFNVVNYDSRVSMDRKCLRCYDKIADMKTRVKMTN
uniref:Ig-like domain-containing protein n=1 Tax=Biomphalaria glabrata TaxID=6526 RepID=A0A2C9LIM0_BIOGL